MNRAVAVGRPESPVRDPAKLMRVAHTALAVSGATTSGSLDEATRTRLAHTWATLMAELDSAVSEDAMAELRRLLPPTNEPVPSEGDLRLTEAQIVGWLNGLMMGETMSTWMAGVAGEQHLARSLASTLAQHAPAAVERPSDRGDRT